MSCTCISVCLEMYVEIGCLNEEFYQIARLRHNIGLKIMHLDVIYMCFAQCFMFVKLTRKRNIKNASKCDFLLFHNSCVLFVHVLRGRHVCSVYTGHPNPVELCIKY